MKDLAIDPGTGDLVRTVDGFGETLTVADDDWTAQKISIKLHWFKGEYYLDKTLGLPYIPADGEPEADQATLDTDIQAAIMSVTTVQEITAFSSTFNSSTREYHATFTAQLKTGSTVSGSI